MYRARRYLLHHRDAIFTDLMSTIGGMQIHELVTAPRSPWQNAYVERLIGSIPTGVPRSRDQTH